MTDYRIEWLGDGMPNYWHGRDGNQILAITDHIMEGTIASSDSWFKNPDNVSANFGVGVTGRIVQWVREQDSAWANGIPQSPDSSIPWLVDAVNRGINLNRLTISIEHEGHYQDGLTEAQYQATLWLHDRLCRLFNIPRDRQHIIGHYQIMRYDRANCPGPKFPWSRLMTDLQNLGFRNVNGLPTGPSSSAPGPSPAPAPDSGVGPIQANGLPLWLDLAGPNGKKRIQYGFLERFLNPPLLPSGATLQDRIVAGTKFYGLPLTGENVVNKVTKQAFERYVMEWNPANPPDWQHSGALAGVAYLSAHADEFPNN